LPLNNSQILLNNKNKKAIQLSMTSTRTLITVQSMSVNMGQICRSPTGDFIFYLRRNCNFRGGYRFALLLAGVVLLLGVYGRGLPPPPLLAAPPDLLVPGVPALVPTTASRALL